MPGRRERRDGRKSHDLDNGKAKNLIATIGMVGLAVGATLLVEGGPWKSKAAAMATVVGLEQLLEGSGFFDRRERERVKEGDRRVFGSHEGRRSDEPSERRYAERRYSDMRGFVDESHHERRFPDTRDRDRDRDFERERDLYEEERRERRRERRRRERERRFDDEYEIEEVH